MSTHNQKRFLLLAVLQGSVELPPNCLLHLLIQSAPVVG